MNITFNTKFNEYIATDANGTQVATAHCINVPADMWSITTPPAEGKKMRKMVGMVQGKANAEAQLTALVGA